jgi:6-phosphogluconolactonase
VNPPPSAARVFDDAEAVAVAAAKLLVGVLPRGKGSAPVAIALAGGRTPLRTYELVVARAKDVEWSAVHLFWGDERCVPPDDRASNYRATKESLLDHVPIPPANVHRIRGEDGPERAAAHYENELHDFFAERGETSPAFDLVLLGMGGDGHTASLFPRGPELDEKQRWVVASVSPVAPRARVTLTLPALAAARRVVFLVTGPEKRDPVFAVFSGDTVLPAARVHAGGKSMWLLDRAAAG